MNEKRIMEYRYLNEEYRIRAVDELNTILTLYPEMLEMLKDIRDTLESGDTPHIYKIDELIKKATEL
jgi:hypothetical protein